MVIVFDTVDDRIQNTILAAVGSIITPRIELAVRSLNASFGRDYASLMAISERGEQLGITASSENESDRINTFHKLNLTDETQKHKPKYVSEFPVPRAFPDRQPHTRHSLSWRQMLSNI